MSTTDERLDLVFHALSNRTRRALLARLSRQPAKVTDLAAPFAMSLPAVSRHIRVLEEAQLVRRAIDGRVHQCSLDTGALERVDAWLDHYRHFWEGTLDSLVAYVERS
jgi:DNA-binding transcriptional ArsR family regulator